MFFRKRNREKNRRTLTQIWRRPSSAAFSPRAGDLLGEVGGDHGARQHDAARQRQQASSGLASRPHRNHGTESRLTIISSAVFRGGTGYSNSLICAGF